jgi:tRNA-2-methylthio-N6-dimethylallyladenosine synthase
MNENDSEHLAGLLLSEGARPAAVPEDGDLLIINTCAVRTKSVDKVYSLLGRLKRLKLSRNALIAVTGCVAQLYRRDILRRYPYVDLIVGPDNYAALPELLIKSREEPQSATSWHSEWQELPTGFRAKGVSAYVTIMEGCDNFCSYCVVPFTRGRVKFRPLEHILAEAENALVQGYKEIQLLGQNVNIYRDPGTGKDFPTLLRTLGRMAGKNWIRFITSHPRDFSRELAETMAETPSICPQLHLPIQAGSDSILKEMNRGYTRAEYLDRIHLLRKLMPDIALSTDIIVGFPGESESDFQHTLDVLQSVRYTNIFSFRYSPRPRTTAARNLPDSVPLEIKKSRLIQAQTLQKKIQLTLHRRLVGRITKVLCTGASKKDGAVYAGRNAANQVVNFTAQKDQTGRFVEVEVTSSGPYSLRGSTVRPAPK